MSNYTEMDFIMGKAPESIHKTHNNKALIMSDIECIQQLVKLMAVRTKHIPELDDEKHSALVQTFRENVHTALVSVETAWKTGYR